MKTLLGRKIGMTQVFADDSVIPVTVIEAGPCYVTQIKKVEKEGYEAVQIGYGEVKDKQITKPKKGHFEKAKVKPTRYLAEYRLQKGEEVPELGSALSCEVFQTGELANVTSVSKGKGFQGVVKRWGFAGGPGGHGSHFHRAPGSIGMAATPSRVFKGMKMPGQMGGGNVTTKNLEIVKVDTQQNLILVKGAVPGGKGALVMIKATGKVVKKPAKLAEITGETEEATKSEERSAKFEGQKEEKKEEQQKSEVRSAKSEETKSVKEKEKSEERSAKSEETKKVIEESKAEEQKPGKEQVENIGKQEGKDK